MKKYLLFILVVALAFSCKNAKKENTEAVAKEVKKTEVKLYTFSGGTVFVNNLEVFAQDTAYKGQTKEFSDAFYVIQHPKGNLMWDAGLPEMLVGQPDFTDPSGVFTVSRNDSLVNQLKSIDMTVDDIDFIALSHTHFDHSGHANVLKNSKWLVQESEYDFITSDESQKNNADNYNAIKELTKVQKLNGDHDVFGDGTVVIKSMPGHTPGHQVLFLDLAKNGPILLSGDLYHLYESREHKRVPVFNSDVDQTLKSMDAFETFAKEQGAKVYLQHQKEDFEKMPVAPKYLN
ncbi:N-acyl homoserine lactonase family protein [Aurantibacter crassamenti]|uniref:N-acyl homoserine lactonase family protein n=1 Tax=Aurantibacter crassamenti TaxID=1837375 RepID=UPI001939CA1D|nr:N-acyl homoserine lactonase family protein [Aurantibacter crassamenti]MBM1105336.1 N-acyl homoserine lactonase family protein [Aurantibacter crassamenti]